MADNRESEILRDEILFWIFKEKSAADRSRGRCFFAVRANVFCPFDISVGCIGQVADFEHQEHILSGQDIDGRFQQGTNVPGDPLLPEAEQDKQAIGHADRRGAGVHITHDGFQRLISAEKISSQIQARQKISDPDGPHNDSDEDQNLLPAAETTNLGQLLLVLVGVTELIKLIMSMGSQKNRVVAMVAKR